MGPATTPSYDPPPGTRQSRNLEMSWGVHAGDNRRLHSGLYGPDVHSRTEASVDECEVRFVAFECDFDVVAIWPEQFDDPNSAPGFRGQSDPERFNDPNSAPGCRGHLPRAV